LASNLRLLGVGVAIAGEHVPASAAELLELETELLKPELEFEDEKKLELRLLKLELTLLTLVSVWFKVVLALLEWADKLAALLLIALKRDELAKPPIDDADERGKTDETPTSEEGATLTADALATNAEETAELRRDDVVLLLKGLVASDAAPPHALNNTTASQLRLNLQERENMEGCI